jgi:hypothetical protein
MDSLHQFNWRPGIGDPDIGGWVTVVLYFVAVLSTWKTTRSISAPTERQLWRTISILFVGLGINKQLDLQTALTELGRIIAFQQGWYGERQSVQLWFIIGVCLTSILIATILIIWARKSPAPTWLALVGTATVLAFVLIRAASFHHIDRFIGERILGLKWNWVLEMTGIATVIVASELRRLVCSPSKSLVNSHADKFRRAGSGEDARTLALIRVLSASEAAQRKPKPAQGKQNTEGD